MCNNTIWLEIKGRGRLNHLRGMVVIILFAYALSMINNRKKKSL